MLQDDEFALCFERCSLCRVRVIARVRSFYVEDVDSREQACCLDFPAGGQYFFPDQPAIGIEKGQLQRTGNIGAEPDGLTGFDRVGE